MIKKLIALFVVSLMILTQPAGAYVEQWLADSYVGYDVIIEMDDGTTYEGLMMAAPEKVFLFNYKDSIIYISRTNMKSIELKK